MNTASVSTAFAVPPRLHLNRKRSVAACQNTNSLSFFTLDDYALFSIRGDAQESRIYDDLEPRRRTLVTTTKTSIIKRANIYPMKCPKKQKHLVQLLVDAIKANQIQGPETIMDIENARRRVSKVSIAEHEQYLVLQRNLMQAQKRGLPEILALSQNEAKKWQQMKSKVEQEQLAFCRMMIKGLALESAVYETHVPLFAASWYNAMLTQCWNDIYRLYTRWFVPCVTIKSSSCRVLRSSKCDMIELKEVSTRGVCCTIGLTKLVAGQPVTSTTNESKELALDVASPRHVISADAQAKELMETYDCDISISSSTLVTLFDSNTSTCFGHVPADWGVPMKSRATSVVGSSSDKKRVYLDRPLPGSCPSTREKVAKAGRAALLSRFEAESISEGSTGGQTVYYLWQLDEKRILVRCTTHVHMNAPTPSGNALPLTLQDEQQKKEEGTASVSVFVKPDYHLLGVEEQLTTSERCRFWFHSWLRGGSTILVARVNPINDVVSSWKTYSPASLIFGDKSEQSLPLENFTSSSKFQWLSTLFTGLMDLPIGNYLLRSQDAHGPSTFGTRRDGVEVLMATGEPVDNTAVIDLYSFMPKTHDDGATAASSNTCVVLPAWNLCDRIPYTFQTGMYCQPFFLEGVCPNVFKDGSCEYIHLRLPEQRGSKKPMKTERWSFDNYTNTVKMVSARRNVQEMTYRKKVTLQFAFCGEEKTPPLALTAADLYAPVHCPKRSKAVKCLLPHFTLHEILERLADDILRKERGKRRAEKSENRKLSRHKTLEASEM